MTMKKLLLFFVLAVGFASCSPLVQKNITKPLTPLESTRNVAVYDIGEIPPDYAEVIGSIRVVDGGFTTHCDWETVLEKAKATARAAGGNGIEILDHSYPGENGSTCHQIAAFILHIDPNNTPVELSMEAQENFHDYVILTEGDTTRCVITDETDKTLTFIYEGQGIKRRAQLSKDKILAYHVDDPVALADQQYQRNKKVFHVRFGFDGGYGLRTAKYPNDISNDYKDYLKKLSRGPELGANLRIDIDKMFTIGIHYDRFISGNSASFYAYDDYGNYHEGLISSDYFINFFAASAGYQFFSSNEKHRFFVDYLLGYMNYHDDESQFGDDFRIDGATLATGFAIDYDYMLSKHVAIGAGLSYYFGVLSRVYINGYEQNMGDSKEGLQRLNFKAGIRFYL